MNKNKLPHVEGRGRKGKPAKAKHKVNSASLASNVFYDPQGYYPMYSQNEPYSYH